jgi:hypothetical protein
MEIIKAAVELDDDEYQDAYGNAEGQSGYIDQGIVPVTDQIPAGGFEMIFEHKR